MNRNPVDIALLHVSETKHLLDALITSSESFDYRKAKSALKALEKKARELEKLQTELQAQSTEIAPTNVLVFPNASNTRPASRF
jgi:hypothetical protein